MVLSLASKSGVAQSDLPDNCLACGGRGCHMPDEVERCSKHSYVLAWKNEKTKNQFNPEGLG